MAFDEKTGLYPVGDKYFWKIKSSGTGVGRLIIKLKRRVFPGFSVTVGYGFADPNEYDIRKTSMRIVDAKSRKEHSRSYHGTYPPKKIGK